LGTPFDPLFHREANDLQKEMAMENNTNNRDQQFHWTPAVIEANRKALQQLPLEELHEMFRIQEGRDSSDDSQPVVGRARSCICLQW
jgi:hypothetical protein